MNIDLEFKYKEILETVKKEFNANFDLGIILGSGLGNFASNVKLLKSIETNTLPNYPVSTVEGHKGYIHHAEFEGKNLLLFQGRIHYYEGYAIDQVLLPILIMKSAGINKIFLSNAAGGINRHFKPGDLMAITGYFLPDIKKDLAKLLGATGVEMRNNMRKFPSDSLKEKIEYAAVLEGIKLKEGSYYYSKGPSYETPAEINYMNKIGADAVGMSTAHEALFAQYLGIESVAVSLITNYAAGISQEKLSHQEVIDTANEAAERFERLLKRFISLI